LAWRTPFCTLLSSVFRLLLTRLVWISISFRLYLWGDRFLATEAQTAFISYSREDSEFALRLAGDLKAAGAAVWLDQLDIAPGQRWARAVEDALNDCPRMLVILSPASVDSTNVEDEIAFALEEGKIVIPVLYRECRIPFRLRSLHYVHFKSDYVRSLAELVRALIPEEKRQARGSWERQDSGTEKALMGVAFVTSKIGWAVGEAGTILHTDDGGITWKLQADGTSGYLRSVAFVTAQKGWIVGERGVILRTEDGGDTWQEQESGTVEDLLSVAFATPDRGWAVGFGGVILCTEDGGFTWRRQTSGMESPEPASIIDFRPRLEAVAFRTPSCVCVAADEGTILHTDDGGSIWRKQIIDTIDTSESFDSVAFATPSLGWIAGMFGSILHTDDAGKTWRRQTTDTFTRLFSVAFATPVSGWVVGGGGVILGTSNGGQTWKEYSSGIDENLISVAYPTPESAWAVGHEGIILHWQE
jgi:photosystem II stability/assembly factor-like uncharacterized protein